MLSVPSLNCEGIRKEPHWLSDVQDLRSIYLAPDCIFLEAHRFQSVKEIIYLSWQPKILLKLVFSSAQIG